MQRIVDILFSYEKERVMSRQSWNSFLDFVVDLMLNLIAGAIVIGFTTFLMSLLLLYMHAPTAVLGIQICTGAFLCGAALIFGIDRMTSIQ